MKASSLLLVPAAALLFACSGPGEAPVAEATDFPAPAEFVESLGDENSYANEAVAAGVDFSVQVMERAPRPYNFSDIPAGWIQPAHIPELLELTESEEECYIPIDPKECAAGHKVTTKGAVAQQLLTSYVDDLSPTRAYAITPLPVSKIKESL